MMISWEYDIKFNRNKTLLTQRYIIDENKRQEDAQHFDKTK